MLTNTASTGSLRPAGSGSTFGGRSEAVHQAGARLERSKWRKLSIAPLPFLLTSSVIPAHKHEKKLPDMTKSYNRDAGSKKKKKKKKDRYWPKGGSLSAPAHQFQRLIKRYEGPRKVQEPIWQRHSLPKHRTGALSKEPKSPNGSFPSMLLSSFILCLASRLARKFQSTGMHADFEHVPLCRRSFGAPHG